MHNCAPFWMQIKSIAGTIGLVLTESLVKAVVSAIAFPTVDLGRFS